MEFVVELQKGDLSMVAVCRQFEIGRKDGHEILERPATSGLECQRDPVRALRSHPSQVSVSVEMGAGAGPWARLGKVAHGRGLARILGTRGPSGGCLDGGLPCAFLANP